MYDEGVSPLVSAGGRTMSLERSLRVGTVNVHGLATKRRQNQLYRIATENELDILAVQETKVELVDKTDDPMTWYALSRRGIMYVLVMQLVCPEGVCFSLVTLRELLYSRL